MFVARATAPTAAISGCQGQQHRPGYHSPNSAHEIESGNQTRRYGIFVPANYNNQPTQKWPLILDFHGRGGSSDGQFNNSQYYLNKDGKNYVVAYPLGCEGRDDKTAWQGASYADPDCDDLLFTSDLVHHLEKNYCIDSDRVYASGKSNGGGFVDTLACSQTGDLFAAFAMSSAALYTDNKPSGCACRRRIMEAHGVLDHTIPIGGESDGAGGITPNITTWTGWWGQRDGCELKDREVTKQSWGDLTTFSCNSQGNVVNQLYAAGLGHCWPSIRNNTDSPKENCDVHTLDFTQTVVDFFARWSKSN